MPENQKNLPFYDKEFTPILQDLDRTFSLISLHLVENPGKAATLHGKNCDGITKAHEINTAKINENTPEGSASGAKISFLCA